MVTLFLKSFSRPGFEHGNVVFFNLSQDLTALQWPRVDPIVSSGLVESEKIINIFFFIAYDGDDDEDEEDGYGYGEDK